MKKNMTLKLKDNTGNSETIAFLAQYCFIILNN